MFQAFPLPIISSIFLAGLMTASQQTLLGSRHQTCKKFTIAESAVDNS
jgi:hypothetical protein